VVRVAGGPAWAPRMDALATVAGSWAVDA